jgi:hypothetical protein
LDIIRNKLSSLVGSIYSIARCIPIKSRPLIYNSLVKPHLLYLIEIWGTAAKTNLQRIQTLQNKLIKILYHYDFLTPTKTIYKQTKFLNIRQLFIYNTCIFIYKITHNMTHSNILFATKGNTLKHLFRRANHLVLPNIRTNYGKNNITFVGAQLYNKFSSTVKNTSSLNIFKKNCLIIF